MSDDLPMGGDPWTFFNSPEDRPTPLGEIRREQGQNPTTGLLSWLMDQSSRPTSTKNPYTRSPSPTLGIPAVASTERNDEGPRLLLMGQKRSGKTSIRDVVFNKMLPSDTIFIEATTSIKRQIMRSYTDFQIWDLPGQINYLDPSYDTDSIFGGAGAMIWVLDAQDDYLVPIGRLTQTILYLQQYHPEVKFAVFIHKTDSLADDFREDTVRDIIQRITDDLFDNGLENPPVSFYPTSIYNSSIYEAFSKVIQKLVTPLPTLEALLNTTAASCKFDKVYLFDVLSKIYIASDTSPNDMATYEICSDYMDLIADTTSLYLYPKRAKTANVKQSDQAKQHGDVTEKENELIRNKDIKEQTAESGMYNMRGYSIHLKEINKYLVVIGLSKEPRFEQEKNMVARNVAVLQDSLLRVFTRT